MSLRPMETNLLQKIMQQIEAFPQCCGTLELRDVQALIPRGLSINPDTLTSNVRSAGTNTEKTSPSPTTRASSSISPGRGGMPTWPSNSAQPWTTRRRQSSFSQLRKSITRGLPEHCSGQIQGHCPGGFVQQQRRHSTSFRANRTTAWKGCHSIS